MKSGVCCQDSLGQEWLHGKMKGYNSLRSECGIRRVQKFLPRTCKNSCYQEDIEYHFDDEGDDISLTLYVKFAEETHQIAHIYTTKINFSINH